MIERWCPVLGFEDSYEVSDQGRVRTLARIAVRRNGSRMPITARVLRTHRTPSMGYHAVKLQRGGRETRVSRRVHVLMLEAFVGARPDGAVGCHADDNVDNNTLPNLRWDTQKHNIHDILRNGNHHLANKTHCPQGHEYSAENTYINASSGGRMCRTCMRNGHAGSKRRAKRALSTHCGHGHEYTTENTYIERNGHRRCRRCAADAARRRYLAKHAQA